MTKLNSITGVVQGEFGRDITLVVVDSQNDSLDVSTYTSKTATLRPPDKAKTLSLNCDFTTDGTDGSLYFTPEDGDIDKYGEWEGQLVLTKTGVEVRTLTFIMDVEKEF